VLLAKGFAGQNENDATLEELFPAARNAHEDIPEPARTFLQQAFETKHAPDAAAMVAGSAVDAMPGLRGRHRLRTNKDGGRRSTEGMGAWAHEVRLGSNRPRHADKENPHVSPEEALNLSSSPRPLATSYSF
jgi:hypothetical protein